MQPDDVVWVLGDVTMSRPSSAMEWIRDRPGRKRLVAGNHDRCHPMHRDAWKQEAPYREVFEWVTPFARTRVLGVEVALSHFPYHRDRHEPRHLEWRLRNEGLPLLHGHTHGREVVTSGPGLLEVHVGLDAHGLQPVSDRTVLGLLTGARAA